ncbi:response regulator [Desulfobulbus propionicus]
MLVVYDKLQITGLNWYLISKIDWHEVTAPVRKMYLYILMTAAALLILVCAGALYLSRTLTRPIVRDMEFAEAIARGELDATLEVDQKDELGDLARALNSMARNLQNLDWLKRGKEGLNDDLRGEHESDALARRLIAFMAKHLGAQLGAIYLRNENDLVLRASWAFSDRQGNFNRFSLGEGMVGQAALENQIIVFSKVEEDAPSLNYGAGEQIPAHFMAVPVTLEKQVLGVLLLGSIKPFSPLQKAFIEQNIENVAILLNAANSRQMIRELLDQAKEQQEKLRVTNEELEEQAKALRESEAELQAQQEELRVINEELEEQTKALKESEAELQAQQEELRVTNEELEERTRALEEQARTIGQKNDDLVKAQNIVRQKARDLEQTSKYKSEFLANMSHEFRTPLNSILILSQLFGSNKEGNLTPKQIESAKAIHSSGSELLNLINEILDLSKVEAGKIELNIEEVFIEDVVTDLERMFKDMAKEKGLKFTTAIVGDIPKSLVTDSQRLQQVLRNLISNAFKFTEQGIVAVTLSRPDPALIAGTGLKAESSIAFAVRDEGIGIPREKQEAIFGAFQQADGSTSRIYGGTGLGLSISKELMLLLGGVIRLASTEGKGSTFTIVLPEIFKERAEEGLLPKDLQLGNGEQATEVPESTSETFAPQGANRQESGVQDAGDFVSRTWMPGTGPGEVGDDQQAPPPWMSEYLEDDRESVTPNSRSLLIIEDDRSFAQVLRDFGRERGFLCLVAKDGETGLHFADYYQPSAIILDIGLPGIDGWTVMERLKENSKLRHIPVHFMSADDKSLDALKMGAIGFLSKPVSVEKVAGAFAKLEAIIAKPVSKLLVVEDNKAQRDSIVELVGGRDVETTAIGSGQEALTLLEQQNFDCMILDLGLEDMSGFDLLEKIRRSAKASRVPVIIYTGRDLTKEEEHKLKAYAESIIIKGAKSPERLLDESALFLHRVEADLPVEQKNMLRLVHDRESILSGKRILLVDDDMRNVFALTSVLEDSNMEVMVAKNGLECLEKLKEEGDSIDCILMDIMMPQMDGYEAMRQIRKERKYAKLPIIALTAKAMKGDRDKCIEAGASDYLAKPVNTDKLLSMMKVWLY